MEVATKKCSRCSQVKAVAEFYHNRLRPDGLSCECKQCMTERRPLSLDNPYKGFNGKTLGDALPAKGRRFDPTYERVFAAMAHWLRDGTLKPAQAEAVYLYAVELLSFWEIADLVRCNYQTVHYHYTQGINRLRERYKEMIA